MKRNRHQRQNGEGLGKLASDEGVDVPCLESTVLSGGVGGSYTAVSEKAGEKG